MILYLRSKNYIEEKKYFVAWENHYANGTQLKSYFHPIPPHLLGGKKDADTEKKH